MGVVLRPLRAEDDAHLLALFADPDVVSWNPGPSPEDVPLWREQNTEVAADYRTWAITDEADRFLGLVSVFSIADGCGEIGFRTAPAARGRGVARTAVVQACAEVAQLGVTRLELWHAVSNAASCSVAAACGFELEAELPANHRYGDGELHDEHRHVRQLHVTGAR